MKFIAFILGLLLIAGCAHVSTTSSSVNINGTWEGELDNGMGDPIGFVKGCLGVMCVEKIGGLKDEIGKIRIIYFAHLCFFSICVKR